MKLEFYLISSGNSVSLSTNISNVPSGSAVSFYQWLTTNGQGFNNINPSLTVGNLDFGPTLYLNGISNS